MTRIFLLLALLGNAAAVRAEESIPPVAAEANASGLDALLAKAGAYAARYEAELADLVAEESYVQRRLSPGGRLRKARQLRSDIVLVPMSEAGALRWVVFRDVFEVDGKRVADREARVKRLFLDRATSEAAQGAKVLEESARYNIGIVQRNLNLPILALVFLHPENQPRFELALKGTETVQGVRARVVALRETASPAFVQGEEGRDLPCRGRVWIDPERGRVLRSELRFEDGDRLVVDLITRYGSWEGAGVLMPMEMRDSYDYRPGFIAERSAERLEATARYTNFRRYDVSVGTGSAQPVPRPSPTDLR
jgi:hypothetical protein